MNTTDAVLIISKSRYDRSKVPESSWPDGSPVSNWSKAVAALRLEGGPVRVEGRNTAFGDVQLAAAA
jgi:hypothetical protein